MLIKVKVKPNAKKNEIKQVEDNFFEIKTTAVPEKGKENQKVIEMLSKHFKVPKSRIKIVRGETSREKIIEIL